MEQYEKIVSSERIYEGRILNMRVDTVALPSGRLGKREMVEHRGAVCVVPVLADGRVVTVRQFRLATGGMLLEVPAGGLERDEEPEACARRELIEECGLIAGRMSPLFSCYLAPGYSSEKIFGFLAEDLTETERCPDEDENLEVASYALEELLPMIDDGRICDSKTICAVLALYRHRMLQATR